MKIIKILSALVLLQGHLFAAAWLTDFSAAQAQAKAEDKLILLDFTGSDWCGWCIKLKNEVFSQPEFDAFANNNLVLVEVDFPRGKALPPNARAANQALAAKYHIRGYPTIILCEADGNIVGETGYHAGGPKPYIVELQKLSGGKLPKIRKPGNIGEGQQPDPVKTSVPIFNGAPTAPPPVYKELHLKGISGPKGRRLAIINNQTMSEGESAMVKLGNAQVKVQCLEIGLDSVVVQMDGRSERKTLRLQGRL